MIPLKECQHGYTYRIVSRNLSIGVFNKENSGFVGIREKFGDRYLFTEYHRDTGAPYGTVAPQEEIEKCPVDDIRERFETICIECGGLVDFVKKNKDGTGDWGHTGDPGKCEKILQHGNFHSLRNNDLLVYLEHLLGNDLRLEVRRLKGIIEDIYRVIEPKISCPDNRCEGCKAEMEKVFGIAEKALFGEREEKKSE